jgi:ABC-type microcin C transport system permease subunit YejE
MKIKEIMETASATATASGNIAAVANPVQAHAKLKRDKNGIPVAPQAKNPDGTAKNALDVKANIMGSIVKR